MKKFTLSLVFVFALGCLLTARQEQTSGSKDWENQLRKYSRIYTTIKKHYPKNFDKEKLFFASIEGFLKRLDPHSYFLDPLELRSMNEDQQGNYFGIGTRITKYEDRLTVVTPLKDSPASKLGILPGDVIVSIEGKETKEMSLDDATNLLRGAKNTFVTFEILRTGIDHRISFKVKRAEIPLESVSYALVHPENKRVGYISIRTFGNTTAKECEDKLKELVNEKKVEAIILDLRGNAGGALYAAVDISDLFLPRGKVIVSLKGRGAKQNFIARKNDPYETMPVAVLINRGSASASEIVASALQDHDRAVILGTRSWGKGLVQTVHKLEMSTSVALTTAKYYTPKNKCLQRDYGKLDDYLSVLYQKDYDTDTSVEGGVMPDILIEGEFYSSFLVRLISKGAFFQFARQLIDNGLEIKKDFKATEKVIEKFKKFLRDNKIEFKAEEFKKDRKAIGYEIEKDAIANKYSDDEGYNVFLKSDPVTRKAVEQLIAKLEATKENDSQEPGKIPGKAEKQTTEAKDKRNN